MHQLAAHRPFKPRICTPVLASACLCRQEAEAQDEPCQQLHR